ncbi:MAG TPA: hypothetical protein DEE98_02740 [Elusimicrobia bacterium]|nr:MAG: hypothetical protein A2278_07570 [Elusimicrobia bacterium RIFOXYA12_FULL_49_49]OGS11120.1 MAG: hypothetical protein A2386_05865 [Elusimicrobia bacterium RIFOXYB1_FULL_48_9]OGS16075.1 MAG: hypothetical protein A2251_02695 [Elusimicrobia bacterium RIFOXYA2_FULL_47_53]OGS26701.1 MAG: hypothetical protein A2339_03745 [Elusimicrobia bacterium RIFOXYB12_FULL_50_12]OGS30173.1 MAG: hypothetical protein A2323_01840 [Elusimicrobia bacterium RIFOXYB2_FULL_46_23]HBU69282.1 hypothetical protein [El
MNILGAFILRDLAIEKKYRFHLLIKFADFVFQMAIFYFIAGYLSKPGYFDFVVVGLIFSRFFQFWINIFAQVVRQEQYWGTAELLFLSPKNPVVVLFSSVLLKFIVLLLEVFSYLAVSFYVFGAAVKPDPYFLLLIFVNGIAFAGLGLISASFVMYLKRGDPVSWLLSAPIDILSGVYFPVAVLPDFLKHISAVIPTTPALLGWRAVIVEGRHLSFPDLSGQALWAAALITAGIFCFKIALKLTRKKGELGSY